MLSYNVIPRVAIGAKEGFRSFLNFTGIFKASNTPDSKERQCSYVNPHPARSPYQNRGRTRARKSPNLYNRKASKSTGRSRYRRGDVKRKMLANILNLVGMKSSTARTVAKEAAVEGTILTASILALLLL